MTGNPPTDPELNTEERVEDPELTEPAVGKYVPPIIVEPSTKLLKEIAFVLVEF